MILYLIKLSKFKIQQRKVAVGLVQTIWTGQKSFLTYRRPSKYVILYPSFGNLTTHITIMTGGSGLVDKGRILSIGGSSMFNVWEKDSQCDQLSGTRQGPL